MGRMTPKKLRTMQWKAEQIKKKEKELLDLMLERIKQKEEENEDGTESTERE